MPKPNDLPQWATQNLYQNGPDAGTPTKATPPQAKQDEGWLPTEPPPAQWQNSWQNLVYEWTKWVDEGKSSYDADAHLVETDAQGHAKAKQLSASTDVGNAVYGESNDHYGVLGWGENTGVAGVGKTNSTGVLGIGGPQGGSGVYGLGSHDAIGVWGNGAGTGTGVRGQSIASGYGVEAIGRVQNPTRASLRVYPQDEDPSSLQNGDVWAPDTHKRMRVRVDDQSHTLWSTPAGMVNQLALQGPVAVFATNHTFVNAAILNYSPISPEVGELRIHISGELSINAVLYETDNTIPDYTQTTQVRVWNATDNELVLPIKLTTIRCDVTSLRNRPFSHMATYTPPSPGPKVFYLQFNNFSANLVPDAKIYMIDGVLYVSGIF